MHTAPSGISVLGLDEDRAPLLELLDDVAVVDDLFTDVDGCAEAVEGPFDHLDGAVDPGAVPPGSRKHHLFLHWLSSLACSLVQLRGAARDIATR